MTTQGVIGKPGRSETGTNPSKDSSVIARTPESSQWWQIGGAGYSFLVLPLVGLLASLLACLTAPWITTTPLPPRMWILYLVFCPAVGLLLGALSYWGKRIPQ
jgi:hypothetical protein